MAKVRKLSTEAVAARSQAATLESRDPPLGAAIVAATIYPEPGAFRAVAEEYKRLGVFDRAHHYLNKALLLDSRDAATHDALARLWRDYGFPQLGLSDAHRAVYYAPSSPIAHNTLGTLLQGLGRRDLARAEYQRALELDAKATYALNNLCYGWVLDANAPKAIATCRQALELQPDLAAAHNNLALAHAIAGDMRAARAAFEATGDRAQSLYNVGVVDLAQGRYTSAVRSFTAAHIERPSLAMAAERARQASARAGAAASEE
jgi:tetratricopeptide (TPR) repeat protein